MFDRIFADYLVECGKLTQDNVDSIFSQNSGIRVRLGVIAVSEKLMTIEQVNEVNRLQSVLDKRFGDIAIEKGYLNDEQVNRLLVLQGNAFLSFVQAVVDKSYLSMEDIEEMLAKYQADNNLTSSNIEALKSCDVDRIIPIFLFSEDEHTKNLFGVVIRTLIRLIDYRAYIKKPSVISEYTYESICAQAIDGDYKVLTAISATASSLKNLACEFAGAENVENTEDSLDAICEFINCANGLYASDMSNRNINIDMDAPFSYSKTGALKSGSILCVPVVACGVKVDILIVLNQDYTCN